MKSFQITFVHFDIDIDKNQRNRRCLTPFLRSDVYLRTLEQSITFFFVSREEKNILQEVEQIIQLVKSFFAAEDLHVSHSITL